MKKLVLLSVFLPIVAFSKAQTTIPLEYTPIPGVSYENIEKTYYSEAWATTVVTNVS